MTSDTYTAFRCLSCSRASTLSCKESTSGSFNVGSLWCSCRLCVGRQCWAVVSQLEISGATKQSKISYKATEIFSSLPLTFFNKILLPLGISS